MLTVSIENGEDTICARGIQFNYILGIYSVDLITNKMKVEQARKWGDLCQTKKDF